MNVELRNGFNRRIIGVKSTEDLLADSGTLEMNCFYTRKKLYITLLLTKKLTKQE